MYICNRLYIYELEIIVYRSLVPALYRSLVPAIENCEDTATVTLKTQQTHPWLALTVPAAYGSYRK